MKSSPILVLQARAEARALLFMAGEYEHLDDPYDAALAPLREYVRETGLIREIGAATVRNIVEAAFANVIGVVES